MQDEPHFPLINNSEWVYTELGGPGLVYVRLEVGPETPQGRDLYFRYADLRPAGDAWTRHMRLRNNAVYLVDRFGDEEGPVLRFPMGVRQNWVYRASRQMVVRCFMVDVGGVTVPAGDFTNVLKVEYVYSSGFSEAELYAPDVGLVGYVERYEDQDETYRLLHYRAGDGSFEVGNRPASVTVLAGDGAGMSERTVGHNGSLFPS